MNSDAGGDESASAPAAIIEADGVRVIFFRSGDRYAHRVEFRDAGQGGWRPVWESVEGTADDVWPPSPPLQQLHVEQRPEGPVALLVGMAGRTHWSAAVEVARDESGRPKSIRFELAARVPATGGAAENRSPKLGSAYRIRSSEGAARIGLVPSEGTVFAQLRTAADEQCFVRPDSAAAVGGEGARTVSWRYAIERPA